MSEPDEYSVRGQLLGDLLDKVDADTYPSTTMLNMIESLLEPGDVPAYAETLLAKVREDRFPSIPMLQRVARLVG